MRMMVTARLPVVKGSDMIKNGGLPKVVQATLERIKPESAYFYAENGRRTMRVVFDLKAERDIVPCLEPLMMELDADLEITPVMTIEDLQAGFAAIR
jgi:hypothetical protein